MGILMDIIEDEAERIGQLIDKSKLEKSESIHRPLVEPPPIFIECPLCGEKIIPREHLDQHILARHANRRVYIRADDKIIRDFEFYSSVPNTLRAVLLGTDRAKLTIKQAGSFVKELEFYKEIDLYDHIKRDVSGEIHCKIEYVNTLREFTIFIGKVSEFNYKNIDRSALKHLFLPLNGKAEPDWSSFSERFLIPGINPLEYHYAAGLYDYALGFYMMRTKQEGKDHFENALGLLSAFDTSFAVTACRVLATRMNCFKLLQACSFPSKFAVVNLFFNNPVTRFKVEMCSDKLTKDTQEYGVYIDEFTEIFLQALNAYYAEDFFVLEELCDYLSRLLTEQDRNNQDKLAILRARTAKKREDEKKAQNFYQMLRYHPDFGQEAEEMLQ